MMGLMNKSGKIIFISAELGNYKGLISKSELKERFESGEDLLWLYYEYLESIKQNQSVSKGWKTSMASIYKTSKLFVNVYASRLGQSEPVISKDIQVYACCPGATKTDMNPTAKAPVQQALLTPFYLLDLPYHIHPDLQGRFFVNSKLSSFN